ncbi:MAG: glycosyltransferase family 4 protein [Candidatus Thermoplasmatota archaeon]
MNSIAFIMYERGNLYSGGYLYDEKLIEYLKSKNHHLQIISLEDFSYLENIKHNFSKSLLERLDCNDIDMILQDELCHSSLFRLNQKIKDDIPIISIVHHLSYLAERDKSRSDMYRYFEKKYLKTIDGAICTSKSTGKTVKNLVGIKNVTTAYPGKDHISNDLSSVQKKNTREEKELKILYVGNVLPHKCIDTMIEGIQNLNDVKLTIVGNTNLDKEYSKKIGTMIKKKNIESKVDILGFVNTEVLVEKYKENHLLMLPSKFEGFGITIIEGLKYGLPALVTKMGGPTEIIREGKEGLYIEPEDPSIIESKVKQLKNDRDLIKKMSKNARKRYEELPTWEDSMEKAYQFLAKIH